MSDISSDSGERIPQRDFEAIPLPELVIGLIGAVGTDLALLTDVLLEELESVGYTASFIRLSELLLQFDEYKSLPSTPTDIRYNAYMTAGNGLREDLGRGDAMALLGVAAIRNARAQITKDHLQPARNGRAYIVRSLKHPAEVETLRSIYGRAFCAIGAYASKADRLDSLANAIAESHHDFDVQKYRGHAEGLIHRDEQELSNRFGQNVRHSFPQSDVFIACNKKSNIKQQIRRFIELNFGNTFLTPSRDEQGMFFAHAAALRSADPSRQVGAAITSPEGELLAIGCNEVPKAGGGHYWAGDDLDARDFQLGGDKSYLIRKQMIAEVFSRLQQRGWLSEARADRNIDDLVNEAIDGDPDPALKGTQLMSILEFGRTVHAEMAVLTEAAKRGISTAGATLYCTTFPCHLCARHIVSSGIQRVVYIEPYPKSKARELYPDSIKLDGEGPRVRAVQFEPFVGIAPRQYFTLFEMVDREQFGKIREWNPVTAHPRLKRFVASYVEIESGALNVLRQALLERKLRSASDLGIEYE